MAFRPVSLNIKNRLSRLEQGLDKVPEKAFVKFRQTTPIKSGNARKKTSLTKNAQGGQINGDYPYVNRLNEGYSKQAPTGMTSPTIEYIKTVVKRILGN